MAERVLLLPTGLWVSKAGINVSDSLNEDDYIFSSSFKASRVFKSGSVSLPAQSNITVSYGRTMNGAPMGIFYVLEGSNYIHPSMQNVVSPSPETLEYRAIFNPSDVLFINSTSTARVFHYVVKELET
ncbi:hypothetical protein [Pararhizobium qamdonense]|uniref:hypothetical protein n=1 Tax=Pararhizobium qamdonense TaxID=3031126 RepID=UPI0023E10BF6|nr:hypothetical protein [Pararhizobium qamdonense]